MEEESYEKHLEKPSSRNVFNAEIRNIFHVSNYSLEFKQFPGHCEISSPFFPLFYILNIVRGDANFPNCKFKRDCIKFTNTANSQTHHT